MDEVEAAFIHSPCKQTTIATNNNANNSVGTFDIYKLQGKLLQQVIAKDKAVN